MFLDLRELKRSGKEQKEYFFQYEPQGDLVDIPQVELLAPVDIQGEIVLTGAHSAYVSGTVKFTLQGECTRCLKPTTQTYLAKFDEQVEQGNEDGYPLINDRVDLAKIVEDAILINLPLNFLCDEDCKGICPNCVMNLNDGECECNNK